MPRNRTVDLGRLELPTLDFRHPKGAQIRSILEGLAQRLGPGAMIPSDRQLSDHFGVARMTVRGVVNQLATDGVLDVQHGRGTFVSDPRVAYNWGASYSLTVTSRSGVPSSTIVRKEAIVADDELADALGIAEGAMALSIERIRQLNGIPIGIESVSLPLERFRGIEDVDLAGISLYQLLEDRWGLRRVSLSGTAAAVLPSAEEAGLLGINPATPCMRVRTTNRDETGSIFEAGEAIYRGDRYELGVNYDMPMTNARNWHTTSDVADQSNRDADAS